MTRRTKNKQARAGAVTVEMAFVLPALLLLTFAVFEYGRFTMVRNIIDHATREGARFAVVRVVDQDTDTQDILDYVDEQLVGQGGQLENLNVEIYRADPDTGANIGDWRDAAFGQGIAVRITGEYRPVTAVMLFLPSTVQMEAVSMMKSEAN